MATKKTYPLEKIGGRKFIFAMFVMSLAYVLVILKLMTTAEWVTLSKFIGSAYIIGNIATKGVGAINGN